MMIEKKSLASAATFLAVTTLILVSVYLVGQFALARMLAGEAVATAELWSRIALKDNYADAERLIAQARDAPLAEALFADIDRVLILSAAGQLTSIGDDAGAVEDFMQVMARALQPDAAPFSAESGAYTADRLNFFGETAFRNWVLFPASDERQTRLAVRVEQTETARTVTATFIREVLFSLGVAVITFGSFMAGFSYRQRQLRTENEAIRYSALHDELTGLANRKQFDEFLLAALQDGEQSGGRTALFMLDLDGFKAVNDTLGHPVGDGLLQATAKRLKASLRGGDLLARLSGDEFAIVVPKVVDPTILAPLAERVLQLVAKPFIVEGHEIQAGCSIGLAVAPDNGSDIAALMRNADFALYRAKHEGRRTWRFFDPKMAEDLASRRTLEDNLRHALENDRFQLLYQPQIELSTGRTLGYEAMLRCRVAGGTELIPAAAFVAVAEETGLVVPIGEWVIGQVARDCALIPAERRVAINVSAAQLKRDSIESYLAETLKSADVDPQRIDIEVNETILGRNEEMAFSRLEKIRATGIGIVMDSFGVGTLSLGLLSRYSFDKIKVDRTFLLHDPQKSGAVLAAICSLGRSLGFRVAGQGVETTEHAQLLRAAGCSEAQGFYYAPPMSLDDVLKAERDMEEPQLAAIA